MHFIYGNVLEKFMYIVNAKLTRYSGWLSHKCLTVLFCSRITFSVHSSCWRPALYGAWLSIFHCYPVFVREIRSRPGVATNLAPERNLL